MDSLLTAPRAVDHVPPKDTDTDDVLVEEVDNPMIVSTTAKFDNKGETILHITISRIRPVPMHKKQSFQEPELGGLSIIVEKIITGKRT